MKFFFLLLAAAIGTLVLGQSIGPVQVELTAPLSGQVVSNTITLTAEAFSAAAPIQRIEFYVDGVLIGTQTVLPRNPEGLRLDAPH